MRSPLTDIVIFGLSLLGFPFFVLPPTDVGSHNRIAPTEVLLIGVLTTEPPKRKVHLVCIGRGFSSFKSFSSILSSRSLAFECGLGSFMYLFFTRVSH